MENQGNNGTNPVLNTGFINSPQYYVKNEFLRDTISSAPPTRSSIPVYVNDDSAPWYRSPTDMQIRALDNARVLMDKPPQVFSPSQYFYTDLPAKEQLFNLLSFFPKQCNFLLRTTHIVANIMIIATR